MAEQRGTCDLARLSAYRDGELSAAEQQEVSAHLEICSSCERTLTDYTRLGSALRDRSSAPPTVMRNELHARLEGQAVRPRPLAAVPGLAAAASVALLASVAIGGFDSAGFSEQLGAAVPLLSEPARAPVAAVDDTHAANGRLALRSAPEVIDCVEPLPGVAVATAQRPEIRTNLGCATDAARVLRLVSQTFERGSLLRRGDTREVYAFTEDGRWRLYVDPGPSAQPVSLSDSGDRIELGNWFRPVLSMRPDLRSMLGRVVGSQQQLHGLMQPYQGGVALWDASGRVYLLLTGGASLHYLDQQASIPGQLAEASGT